MIIMKKSKIILSFATVLCCAFSQLSHAENIDLPAVTHDNKSESDGISETHPTIELTMEKSELIHIEEEIGSIIIGSPIHINVLADSTHTLVVVPRKPGATHFSVLDKHGKLLMQRHVIVAAPKDGYVRVKRTCVESECKDTSVYYCPDMCHEIEIEKEK